jgi:hypothetical protein
MFFFVFHARTGINSGIHSLGAMGGCCTDTHIRYKVRSSGG